MHRNVFFSEYHLKMCDVIEDMVHCKVLYRIQMKFLFFSLWAYIVLKHMNIKLPKHYVKILYYETCPYLHEKRKIIE